MTTVETAAPISREARLAEIVDRIQEIDGAIANNAKRIAAEGRSFELLRQQRDLLTEWNTTLNTYAGLKSAR